jgi:hypothetical protein
MSATAPTPLLDEIPVLRITLPATWAGPSFRTDDPEPIDFRNFELYTFASADGTAVATNTAGPAVEFN